MSMNSDPKPNPVTLEICPRGETSRRALAALGGKRQDRFISFESPALLFKVLTRKRWELLATMTGAGAISIREAARRVGRDVKAVHGDVTALLNAGLLRKTEQGKILFPYDAVHGDFMLSAA
ncbi:MAG: transcriptional regulator [Candidatus Thiosymbion ectosymbiont of Robbea hypermnestra]|nr:transcriptional regulator [Candidatus Thiosymbion ectosymbiont of Robbea hypermnestra]